MDTKIREFQYKVINNILPFNKKLYNWKIKDSSRCDLCDFYPESVEHLFMQCIKSVNLYLQINKGCVLVLNLRLRDVTELQASKSDIKIQSKCHH